MSQIGKDGECCMCAIAFQQLKLPSASLHLAQLAAWHLSVHPADQHFAMTGCLASQLGMLCLQKS